MEDATAIKGIFYTVVGAAGGMAAQLLGGWDWGLAALLTLMAVDFVSGTVGAFVFGVSKKTETGRAESGAMLKGLTRKGLALLLVVVGYVLDGLAGTVFVRDGVIMALSVREVLSFIETLGLVGVPIPAIISKGLEVLNKGEDQDDRQQKH